MENEMTNDSNPALIDMYMKALLQRESTGNYEAVHEPSIITDANTGKKIRVQALGGYGILDINWDQWSKEAGFEGADWHDPKAQDAVAKYKAQQYFDKFSSWNAVSVAWFAGPNKAKELIEDGTIDYDKADSNGTTIKQYVDSMNNLIADELMTMEVPMETFISPGTVKGPPVPPQLMQQKDMQQVFAAQILDAMTKANAGGNRPSFESQVPAQAGDFADAVVEAKVKRGEIR
jgi:hypothetical protein